MTPGPHKDVSGPCPPGFPAAGALSLGGEAGEGLVEAIQFQFDFQGGEVEGDEGSQDPETVVESLESSGEVGGTASAEVAGAFEIGFGAGIGFGGDGLVVVFGGAIEIGQPFAAAGAEETGGDVVGGGLEEPGEVMDGIGEVAGIVTGATAEERDAGIGRGEAFGGVEIGEGIGGLAVAAPEFGAFEIEIGGPGLALEGFGEGGEAGVCVAVGARRGWEDAGAENKGEDDDRGLDRAAWGRAVLRVGIDGKYLGASGRLEKHELR